MKVFVLGGTGFLGYHAVLELLRRGHEVTVLAFDMPEDDLLPPGVEYRLADIDKCSDEEIKEILSGHDSMVFAIGADDRVVPKAPAYEFFYKANVLPAGRLFRLAAGAGLKSGVLCGSYFAYFDRIWPEMKLSEHHPYVRVRREQADAAVMAGEGMTVSVLELPYIFGNMPGRVPLWAPLLKYILSPFPVFYTAGGTTMITVEHVAEAIAGAVERHGESGSFPVGDLNIRWSEMVETFSRLGGRKQEVITMPARAAKLFMRFLQVYMSATGREHGLHPVKFVDVQVLETYISAEDLEASRKVLGFGSGGLEKAFRDTVAACGLLPED
ncbi:MAG TPA: NAD(P)-dependent oxidoreductase [bacterium]|nr:NAD(P)-dependent oxidoreductase [bacterium]